MLVHENAVQVYLMLSAIYQPQNTYCVAVDGKSTPLFKERMNMLAECFPNIHVMVGSFGDFSGFVDCKKNLLRIEYQVLILASRTRLLVRL